ncbi:hypothetical protein K2173_004450 [Erythroxylum novogranatense]|uniref:RING-type E3 ubiquitin transferase n=1 Tax=Erythroxylum novogranatense TaxID=1862640 RepID=A0AAV8T5N5_9ROSI|nr:hypothetical protein K2173_004450 [Erythroxylum novogranatense]
MATTSRSPRINFISTHLLNPPKTLLSLLSLTLLLLLATPTVSTTAVSPPTISSSNFLNYYTPHCHHIVPQSVSTVSPINLSLAHDKSLHFDYAYLTGGPQILPAADVSSVSISFHPKRNSISLTHSGDLVMLQASLKFYVPTRFNGTWRRNLRNVRFRGPKIPVRPRSLVFDLYGYWSMSTRKLCMVGSGSSYPNLGSLNSLTAVLKLNYPKNFGSVSGLIYGVMESLGAKGSFGYFEPVSVLAIPHYAQYNYTLLGNGDGTMCSGTDIDGIDGKKENLHFMLLDPSICLTNLYRYASFFQLEYGSDCGSKCNPLGERFATLPKFMKIQGIRCDYEHGIRVLVGFQISDYHGPASRFERSFDPNTMLIGEGTWDDNNNRLCVVACRLSNHENSLANAYVDDCSIRLSLRFPKTLTVRNGSTVVGQLWSNKTADETGYFSRIAFHGSGNRILRDPDLKYKYTVLDRVSKSCSRQKIVKGKGKKYPNVYSLDMRFDMLVKNVKGEVARGYLSPFFVGDQLYQPYRMSNSESGLLNISYKMRFTAGSEYKLGGVVLSNESVEISAEGTYDNKTGTLCMIGCRHPISHVEKSISDDSEDCEIFVHIQFSPLNAKGRGNVKGTIESMREKSDNLHFEQLEISSESIYTSQAAESIWRMDMEILMVLISNTLACLFVGMQLHHVKQHPNVLPFISFMMLGVLTLGHMIPLLLNFEALFAKNHSGQNFFLETGGWVKVNEVILRVVTMVAFLLELRLLQLTWSARQRDGSLKMFWTSDRRVFYLSSALYIGGGLITWFLYQWKDSHRSSYLRLRHMNYQQHYQWAELRSYAGLILDGFLLPQIIFNFLLNSKEKTLTFTFFFGTTIVRLLPHAYDLYRAHSSYWYLDFSYIYPNHKQDIYSTAWDIIIPICGLLFAILIYLQQWLGGRCIVPRRFLKTSEYEMVPVVGSEEL